MPRLLLQRDAELAALDHRLDRVRAGSGGVIVVEGPAGIGKSSLLSAAGSACRGLRVLRAWGGPLERDAGWGIARQLVAPLRSSPEWPALAVGAAALALRALDGEDQDRFTVRPEPGIPSTDAMHAAAHGLTWLLCGLAEREATLLLVDDVHWADPPSLRWLGQLTRRLDDLPLGILCAVRSGEPPADPELLAELLAAAGSPVRPAPLEPAAVTAFVQQRLPAAGPAFARACHQATAGNPFLLGALLDHLSAERLEPSDRVAADLSAFGPEQVSRAVDRQLSRLPSGTADLARAFAVLGRGTPLRHARTLAGIDHPQACLLMDHLRAAGLLRTCSAPSVDGSAPGDGYELVHPLVAAALYGGLPPGERALWHARAARMLERDHAGPETVALHLLHTEPAADTATVTTLSLAATLAIRRGAPPSAAAFLRRALAEPPPDHRTEADLLGRLGLLAAEQVQPEAYPLLDRATTLETDTAQRARIALSGARALALAGYFEETARLCHRILDDPGDTAADLLDRLESELVCVSWLDTAGVADARSRVLHHRPGPGWEIHRAHLTASDAAPTGETSAILRAAPEPEPDSLLATFHKFTLIADDDLDTARALCDTLIDTARPRGWMTALAHGSFIRAVVLVRAGRISEAVTDGRCAYDFKLSCGLAPGLIWALFPLLDALIEAGDLPGAEAALTAAAPFGPLPPTRFSTAMLLERRARLHLARHRPADAHRDLTSAATIWRALGMHHPGLTAWRVDDCLALTALGDPAAARAVAEDHLRLADRVGLPGPRGAGLRALATTLSPAEAVPVLTAATTLLATSPARLEHTRTLVDLGAALRRANRRTAARTPLGQALDMAERGGMRLLATRAHRELIAAGARPRRPMLSGPAALTPAEHRVAELAARGHSNTEIAHELYITRRTVETHLTHIFQKLQVTRRSALATHLHTPTAG
ncbi:AAA family ATPase [Actinoplanes sp. NPDC051851]|uniref:ATP-binding protein n=1 Tax=Actinoplanes sp. NPDC051851 TaxID=3154753 RepID=UPI00342FA170